MSYFLVSESELNRSTDELKNLNVRYKSEIDNLMVAEQSLNGMWEGAANDSFHNAFMRDHSQMDNFHSTVEQYINALMMIAQRYAEAENRNMSMMPGRRY